MRPRLHSRCPLGLLFTAPAGLSAVILPGLYIHGQIVDELIEGEYAEADFIVGGFGAALKEAGEGHGGHSSRWGWQLQVGQIRVRAGTLIDHPGATPAVWITWKQAKEQTQILAGGGQCWMGIHHPGRI